jgi:hypothetical protein
MNSPRTNAPDGAVQWDSSRSVTRGVSTGVEARRARALGADKDKRKPSGGGNKPSKQGAPSETLSNALGLLWIAVGGIIIAICAVFVIGSVVMFGVLREISDARNYDAAASQTGAYEDFFKSVGDAGFTVGSDKPNIKEGVTQYLWTVTPPNDGALRVFSWQHDLQTNVIRPTSNAAALLDIELGFLDAAKAQEYAQSDGRQVFQFDPQDATTNAIIDRNTSAFARSNGEGWGKQAPQIASAPPLPPPMFDPKARTRKGVGNAPAAEEEEEATAEGDPTEGEDGEQAEPAQPPAETEPDPEPQPPTEVQPADPPAEDAGDGNDDGGTPAPEPPGEGEGDGDGGDATPVG